MTADEAIFKMLVQVLRNQRLVFWMAKTDTCWDDECVNYAIETDELLEQVMEK